VLDTQFVRFPSHNLTSLIRDVWLTRLVVHVLITVTIFGAESFHWTVFPLFMGLIFCILDSEKSKGRREGIEKETKLYVKQ
jgi:hypothetical protein